MVAVPVAEPADTWRRQPLREAMLMRADVSEAAVQVIAKPASDA